jgi:uncharacterized protein
MANFTTSPGVSLNEVDNTFLSGQPVQVGAAIIGPTVKGPVERPVTVTSYSEYVNVFGDTLTSGSDSYSYLTSISAYNYFNYGGKSLLVARVASGSYTPATSSKVAVWGTPTVNGGYISPSYTGSNIFELETITDGVIMNNNTQGGSTGILLSGSKDNIRFEVTSPNTASGTFNVAVRRGDDINNKKIYLETFNNVNLDPNSTRYIAKVIGDQKLTYNSSTNQMDVTGSYPNQSNFVRIKTVNVKTPNYLDSDGLPRPEYTGSIPVIQNVIFGGATGNIKAGANFYDTINSSNTQGLVAANYSNMVNLLSNSNDYKFKVLSTPGLTNDLHTSTISTILTNTQLRGDNVYVLDLTEQSATLADTITQAQTRDNSYATTYWPWVYITDPGTGKQVSVPASTLIPGVYANNDRIAAPWFAPAGINRGGLNNVLRAKYKLSESNKTDLYDNNINPLATLPKKGVVCFGNKTLQKGASALDRVNVRRLLIELKSYIGQLADNIVFENNTLNTRNSFISQVTPYLENIQQREGLYAFQVIMDETNNGPDIIDRNQLIGQIYIQPSRSVEYVSLDFILMPTGADFPG